MAQSVVVTGATGFAGSHLLERLPRGSRVTAFARTAGRAPGTASSDVQWLAADLLDRHAVASAIRAASPDLVFHLAGAPHVGASFDNPVLPLELNALGTHHLLAAIEAEAPRARVVVVTSAMIYEASDAPRTEDTAAIPHSPYGLSKLAQDRLAMRAAESGLDVVVARPFNHTGARQEPDFAIPAFAKQIAAIERGEAAPVIKVGNLDAERDLSDVRDTVDGYITVAASGRTGTAYNVCRGTAFRIGDLLERLVRLAKVKFDVEIDPARVRPTELPRLVGDNSRLRALGWAPRVDVDTMLAGVLTYWRTRAEAG